MLQIRPVSDLRNKFPEVESAVNEGEPVFLTKNGRGAMVVLSMERYAELTNRDRIEVLLDEADREAEASDVRYTLDEVFDRVRGGIRE